MDPHFTKRGWRFVRCTRCGLVSLAPIPDPAAIGDHHEASYRDGRYAAFAAADEIRAGIARDRLARVRPLAPDGPWLDVGCSTGAFLAVAAGGGLDVEGIDVSDAAVAEARRRGLAARQVPVEAFTPRRRYAVVTAFDVVEHLPDPAAFVSRVAGWLAPGGLLALTLPDVTSPTARLLGRYWFFCAPPDHIHYFSPTTVRHLLMQGGIEDVSVRPIWKPLTLAYAAAHLATNEARIARAAGIILHALPRAWGARPLSLPLGEMFVTGRSGRA